MHASASTVKSGSGSGVVKSVDLKAHTVTLDHEPIPAIGWPAMTMTFPVASPDLLNGIAAGQTVTFDVTVTDNKPLITALKR
jgi:Cu(I)/Ag(I) efflux system periplasmic protein CusF